MILRSPTLCKSFGLKLSSCILVCFPFLFLLFVFESFQSIPDRIKSLRCRLNMLPNDFRIHNCTGYRLLQDISHSNISSELVKRYLKDNSEGAKILSSSFLSSYTHSASEPEILQEISATFLGNYRKFFFPPSPHSTDLLLRSLRSSGVVMLDFDFSSVVFGPFFHTENFVRLVQSNKIDLCIADGHIIIDVTENATLCKGITSEQKVGIPRKKIEAFVLRRLKHNYIPRLIASNAYRMDKAIFGLHSVSSPEMTIQSYYASDSKSYLAGFDKYTNSISFIESYNGPYLSFVPISLRSFVCDEFRVPRDGTICALISPKYNTLPQLREFPLLETQQKLLTKSLLHAATADTHLLNSKQIIQIYQYSRFQGWQ